MVSGGPHAGRSLSQQAKITWEEISVGVDSFREVISDRGVPEWVGRKGTRAVSLVTSRDVVNLARNLAWRVCGFNGYHMGIHTFGRHSRTTHRAIYVQEIHILWTYLWGLTDMFLCPQPNEASVPLFSRHSVLTPFSHRICRLPSTRPSAHRPTNKDVTHKPSDVGHAPFPLTL